MQRIRKRRDGFTKQTTLSTDCTEKLKHLFKGSNHLYFSQIYVGWLALKTQQPARDKIKKKSILTLIHQLLWHLIKKQHQIKKSTSQSKSICSGNSLADTHIKDGDDGGVVPTNYVGNIFSLWDLGRYQLWREEKHADRLWLHIYSNFINLYVNLIARNFTMILGGIKSSPSQATLSISLSSSQSASSSSPSSSVPEEVWSSPPGSHMGTKGKMKG